MLYQAYNDGMMHTPMVMTIATGLCSNRLRSRLKIWKAFFTLEPPFDLTIAFDGAELYYGRKKNNTCTSNYQYFLQNTRNRATHLCT